MKKTLSVLGLIAILTMSPPAFAAPGGPGGPGGHGPGGGHKIQAGTHHRPHMAPRHHGGITVHTGHHPRHHHWYGYRTGYWGSPWCDYRLGWCDPYYPPYSPYAGVYVPMGGASFSVRF